MGLCKQIQSPFNGGGGTSHVLFSREGKMKESLLSLLFYI